MSEEADIPVLIEDPVSTATLARMTIPQIVQTVGVLPETLSHDQILEWLMLATVLVQRAREIKQRVEEVAIAWIGGNDPITNGPMVYTVGKTKQVKCMDVIKCMELLLQACGGDVTTLCGYLAANPFKHGSCHDLLGDEQWLSVFRENWQDKIVIKAADTRYLPKSKRKVK